MPRAETNGIEIEYETFGSVAAQPLLLIMGLGAQMILWDEPFCEALAARGYRVVRFDNRDVGASTHLADAGMPDVMSTLMAALTGQNPPVAYTLSDMAADTAGLLDALGIDAAHVVGASLGGMIAQTLAIEHPRRVRSLTSIMSTTSDLALPQPKPEAVSALLTPAPADREGNVERAVAVFRTIGSPGFPFEEERIRSLATRSYDRGYDPAGAARQLVASVASGSRRARLASITAPTLVIHGRDDPLIPVEAGIDTAEHIAGAELLVLDGMGHDLPTPLWPALIDAIDRNARRAA